jgi:hypothetical protein
MASFSTLLNSTWQRITELYGRSFIWSLIVIAVSGLLICALVFGFINAAAPTSLTIASGPPGSSFERNAKKYQAILAKEGVKLTIVASNGSTDNLHKLADRKARVDVAFVQGGETEGIDTSRLMSLGSVAYQPLFVFYRGEGRHLLSEFKGQRIAVGQEGSGTHSLALALLKENDIDAANATFSHESAEEAVQALLDGKIDVMFVMGDTASVKLMKKLVESPGINIFNFTQADGYARRVKFLNKLVLPEGALDLGKNIPVNDLYLVAPTVELIARDSLHPALSDVLLEAAREVHGTAGLFRKSGEFPRAIENEIRISPDATRYYTSGKSFLYSTFPFWLASLINRLLAVLVPLFLLLIPTMKVAPIIYRWRFHSRIYPWYKVLLDIEREAFAENLTDEKRQQLLGKLDTIENSVNRIKIPPSFGDLLYGLKGHIGFVRDRLSVSKSLQPG